MTASNLEEWANSLVGKPINLSDDYGNMMLSLGVAHQQRPQDAQGLQSPLKDLDSVDDKSINESSLKGPSQTRLSRNACETCHERKIKCDVSESGTPCSNCRKAMRSDCKLHIRRVRNSTGTATPAAKLTANANSNGQKESLAIEGPYTVYENDPTWR